MSSFVSGGISFVSFTFRFQFQSKNRFFDPFLIGTGQNRWSRWIGREKWCRSVVPNPKKSKILIFFEFLWFFNGFSMVFDGVLNGFWMGYALGRKKFKALRALNFFALKVLPWHGWGIAGVWLGPSPTNFSTPCPLGGIRFYEPSHIYIYIYTCIFIYLFVSLM